MKDLWLKPYLVVLEVENRKCRILERLMALGLKQFKVVDIRSSSIKAVKHLIELDPVEVRKVKNKPEELRAVEFKDKGKASMWFESEGCEICNAILSRDAFLVSGKSIGDFTIRYSFMVPTFESYRKIVSAMETSGLKVNVRKIGRFEPRTGVLTGNQERVFWLAFKSGFFDYPRKVKTSELAAKLGISPSTLSEITRRGMRRLLKHYFEQRT